jgi:hypothetical protein
MGKYEPRSASSLHGLDSRSQRLLGGERRAADGASEGLEPGRRTTWIWSTAAESNEKMAAAAGQAARVRRKNYLGVLSVRESIVVGACRVLESVVAPSAPPMSSRRLQLIRCTDSQIREMNLLELELDCG